MHANNDENADSHSDFNVDEDSIVNDNEVNNVQSVLVTSTVDTSYDDIDELANQSLSLQESIPNDMKDPLAIVTLEEDDVNALDDMFRDDITDANSDINSTNEQVSVSPGGTKRATKAIDDDCEMTYPVDDNAFKPHPAGFQVKINDDLSGNIPFKDNVSIFVFICVFFTTHH